MSYALSDLSYLNVLFLCKDFGLHVYSVFMVYGVIFYIIALRLSIRDWVLAAICILCPLRVNLPYLHILLVYLYLWSYVSTSVAKG